MKTRILAILAALAISLGIGLSATSASAAGAVLTNSASSATLIYWQPPVSTSSYALNQGASTSYIGSKSVYRFMIPSTCRGWASDGRVSGSLTGGKWYYMSSYGGNNVTVSVTGCG